MTEREALVAADDATLLRLMGNDARKLAVVREAGILKTDVKYEEIIDMSFVESVRASL